jgi:hypothetical protein
MSVERIKQEGELAHAAIAGAGAARVVPRAPYQMMRRMHLTCPASIRRMAAVAFFTGGWRTMNGNHAADRQWCQKKWVKPVVYSRNG